MDIPSGFAPIFRTSPFLETIGPLYSAGSGAQLVVGLQVQEKHTNARGTLHGGVLASIADIALGYGLATSTNPPTSMVTASLNVDFAGSAQIGDWIETSLDIQKVGSRMAFANVYFMLRGERIARASGVFLVHNPRPSP
ncbi:MAG TPA: PaaI family thioesterase [Steroidobacteraceae bacterium]|nr:PaaI family thioesterase [Steroidobacteraceae bacterium]